MSSDLKVQAEANHSVSIGRANGWEGGNPSNGKASPSNAPPGFNSGQGDKSQMGANLWSDNKANNPPGGLSNSFDDLAIALGSGLAESMDNATKGEYKGGGALLTDNFFNKNDDLNYARQTRHAASRLLGAGPSKDPFGQGHTGPEAGNLFSGFDAGGRPGETTKKSSAGQPALFGDYSRDNNPSTPAPGLSAAFSNNEASGYRPSYGNKPSTTSYDDQSQRLPASKDIGMTVREPGESYARHLGAQGMGGRGDGTYEIQRDMGNLWQDRDRDQNRELSPHRNTSAPAGHQNDAEPQMDSEEELRPFTWDVRHHEPSRALAITRASNLSANDVRSVCESYGVVESFRSDFASRGVFFVCYFDMRCAQYAAMDMKSRLQKMGPSADGVLVQFCVPLSSSSQNDESLVVLMDIPMDVNVDGLASMLSSYGAVRSLKSLGGSYGGNSYVVEYHDIQDAKQAVLELESTQPWGPNVSVEAGTRNPAERKRGREILALIGRWRHGGGGGGASSNQRSPNTNPRMPGAAAEHAHTSYIPGTRAPRHDVRYEVGAPPPETQLVVGPDGRYTYVVVNSHPGYPAHGGAPPPRFNDRVVQTGPGGYVTHVNHAGYYAPQTHHFSSGGSVASQSSYQDSHGHYPSGSRSLPYYGGDGASSVGSQSRGSHMMSMPHGSSASAGGGDRDNSHLVLDLDAVEAGQDSRTSLMVRNIPNKYTQQMLLSEFSENGHGPGVIDFFYLPIDFKNRCNRGYAFINFVDYRDILPFHRRYYGKHWRTFNSDKICDITYARIQGKSAMLKRFENSALMEKDDEYKPLVFVSHGPDKGTRLPFPDPSTK